MQRIKNEAQRQVDLLKTGALQTAILTSEYFSSIATDANAAIHIFNVGAQRCLPSMLAFPGEGHEIF